MLSHEWTLIDCLDLTVGRSLWPCQPLIGKMRVCLYSERDDEVILPSPRLPKVLDGVSADTAAVTSVEDAVSSPGSGNVTLDTKKRL